MSRIRGILDLLGSPRAVRAGRAIGMVLLVVAVASNGVAIRFAIRAEKEQRRGRQISTQTTCAATSAVIEAGRQTILAGGRRQPDRFERNLAKLGYPPLEARQKAAELAAQAYARAIASKVQEITGRTDLVQRNGALDCDHLKVVG